MRIALVCDYSLDYLGGAQSAFLDQARIFRERGHSVTIIAPSVGRDGETWAAKWRPGRGGVIPVSARVTLPGVDLPVVRNTEALRARLDEELHSRRIDVVHTHSEFGLSAAVIEAARARNIPTVQTVHTFFWQAPMPRAAGVIVGAGVRGFTRWLRGFAAGSASLAVRPADSALRNVTLSMGQRVDAVVSPSAHQADRLRAAGLTNVHVVPNAIALGEEPGVALTMEDAAAPLRIVWVGRLVPEKRLLEFIDAVVVASARLGAGRIEVQVVGEGPLRAEAERRAVGARVRFAGRRPREEVTATMRRADLVALTSYGFDNQPMIVIEALHAGRSVFYVDPALTEGLESAGILATPQTSAGMADVLVRLANNPAEVVEASVRAVVAAREFDPEVYVTRMLAVYEAATVADAARRAPNA